MKKFLIITAIFLSVLTGTNSVSAANPLGKATSKLDRALGSTGLEKNLDVSIGTLVKGVLSLVGTIFLVLTIWAGVLWMTAQGNDEKVAKAKNILTTATTGLLIIMAAYAITAFVTSQLSNTTGGSEGSGDCTSRLQGVCMPAADCPMGNGQQPSDCYSPNICCLPATN